MDIYKLTVMAEPQAKVEKACELAVPNSNSMIAGPSPERTMHGIMTTELKRLLYHARSMALPLTTSRDRLITTACSAVVTEERIPNVTPMGVVVVRPPGERSRTTPRRKPPVTMPTAEMMVSDGRE